MPSHWLSQSFIPPQAAPKRAKRGMSPILRPVSPCTEIGLTTLASLHQNPYPDVCVPEKDVCDVDTYVLLV